MLTDFRNFFAGRLGGKFAANSYLNIPPHLKYVATLPCEYLCSKCRNAQQVIEANCHVRVSHSKLFLKYLSGKIFKTLQQNAVHDQQSVSH